MGRELRRLNTNMSTDLIERIDEYAERMSISRSSAMNVLCAMALDSQRTMSNLDELMKELKKQQELEKKK